MSLLGPDRMLVARNVVDRAAAECIHCSEPFKFGVNVFTQDGLREIGISGMCEKCFDEVTAEPEEEHCTSCGAPIPDDCELDGPCLRCGA